MKETPAETNVDSSWTNAAEATLMDSTCLLQEDSEGVVTKVALIEEPHIGVGIKSGRGSEIGRSGKMGDSSRAIVSFSTSGKHDLLMGSDTFDSGEDGKGAYAFVEEGGKSLKAKRNNSGTGLMAESSLDFGLGKGETSKVIVGGLDVSLFHLKCMSSCSCVSSLTNNMLRLHDFCLVNSFMGSKECVLVTRPMGVELEVKQV